mgnify:FL=1
MLTAYLRYTSSIAPPQVEVYSLCVFHYPITRSLSIDLTRYSPLENYIASLKSIVYTDVNALTFSLNTIERSLNNTLLTTSL